MNNKIKDYRNAKSLTQDELASKIGVTRQTIISLESGRYDASLKLAHALAVFFGTKIEDIFIFEEEQL